ncbi:MFS general substrate transporter [Dothidotthia symphoricarpi CBS 119687]|uniref:MFS general substrate transporter n=1 Tax=Dothidotthia symphoricarpi CBS 119687 TaxID=1392245 RepID=A0A6A6AMN8_9PLEO|nr:MFS general substrate transporter [Dothidotthia symphoricarpi CBS 119687]KAF2132194.1 MFS general substrate transporter [Dothidotthia symphoricarpi CBS 119687]
MSTTTSLTPSVAENKQNFDIEQPRTDEKQHETPHAEAAPQIISPMHPSQFPEGGKDAWLCLAGAFCCLFCSFGWLNCVGVFQSYYQLNQLHNHSPSAISWISSIQIFVMFFPGPIVGWVCDNHGPKYLLYFGTFFHVLGLMMTSLCTKYWHFILAQAICSPLGLNCIFNAATSTVPTWFLKNRGAAYGIMAAGSGLGGVILPIMTSHLIPQIGFAWTIRTLAFMILGLMLLAMITVKSRLPPTPRKLTVRMFIEPFKDIKFVMLTLGAFLFFLGVFIPINYIQVSAIAHGMSLNMSAYLLPILNSASIFGRIIPGALADKGGKYNMQVLWCTLAGVITLAFIPASSNATFVVFAVLYGFTSGAYVSLLPAQIAQISRVDQIGFRVGLLFSCISFAGLIGNPIGGAIVGNDGKFWGLYTFAGVMMLSGSFVFTIARFYVAEWKLFVKI